MKKILKNYEIEKILTALESENSFVNDVSVKLPKSVRHAMRVNLKVLIDRYQIYSDGKQSIVAEYVKTRDVEVLDDGKIRLNNPNIAKDFMDEINELGEADNTLEIEDVDLSAFDDIDLSLQEDEAIEMLLSPDE